MSKFKYNAFVAKWKETTELPPQTVGPFTGVYKWVTHWVKIMPMPVLMGLSVVFVVGIIVFFGPSIVSLVTILQRGF